MLTFFRGIEDTVNSRKTGEHAAAEGAVRDGEKFDILTFVQKTQNMRPINKRKLAKTAKIFHSWLAN